MAITSPPGLPDPEPQMLAEELSSARLHAQNALLAENNRRLAEENARLLHAQLLEENAALTRQNQLLKSGPAALPAPALAPLLGPPPGQLKGKTPPPGNWAPPAAPPGRLQPDKAAPPGNWAAPAGGRRRRSGTGSSEGSAASGSGGSNAGFGAPAARLPTPSRESTVFGSSRDDHTDSSLGSIRSASASRSAAGSDCSGATRPGAEPAADEKQQHLQTTVMMRNVPNNYTRELLLRLLDAHGFQCKYNLVYLPIDFSSEAGFGYAFVNLVSTEEAVRFREHFQGFRGWELPSEKVCDVLWSAARQGLQANIERFRNSPVMHETVPDTFRPALFDHGQRIPFPPPTRKPRAPDVGSGRAQ